MTEFRVTLPEPLAQRLEAIADGRSQSAEEVLKVAAAVYTKLTHMKAMPGATKLTVDEVYHKLLSGWTPYIADVDEADEFIQMRLSQARNVPLFDLWRRRSELLDNGELFALFGNPHETRGSG